MDANFLWLVLSFAGLSVAIFCGKSSKKWVLAGLLLSIVSTGIFIFASVGGFRKSARETERNLWNAEACGVVKAVQQIFRQFSPDSPVLVMGFLTPEQSQGFMDILARNHVEAQYVQLLQKPPVAVGPEEIVRAVGQAMEKMDGSFLVVFRGAPLPLEYLSSEIYDEKVKFIQTGIEPNKILWERGVIAASVVPKIGVP